MIAVKASSNTFLAVTLTTALAVALYVCPRRRRFTARFKRNPQLIFEQQVLDDEEAALLTNHTDYVEINQHELRVIDIPHHNDKAPLMVFIHGLGGQAAQWEYQLQHYSKSFHVVAVDLLGCGYSEVVSEWSPYTATTLADDVIQLVLSDRYSDKKPLILVGHSYGCSIATFVASSPDIRNRLEGLILISPKADLGKDQAKGQMLLPWIPDFLIDNARNKDRQGGLHSKSVERLLGTQGSDTLRRKQLRWNIMSRTDVYKRFAVGATFPTSDVYGKLASAKVLLIGGEDDKLTPSADMSIIRDRLVAHHNATVSQPHIIPNVGHMSLVLKPEVVNSLIDEFLSENNIL